MEKLTSAYTIPNTEQFTMYSYLNQEYRIFTYIPSTPAPASGYPTIYLLDGNAMFGSIVETSRLQAIAGSGEHAVIVGIGYKTDNPYHDTARVRDFTMNATEHDLPVRSSGKEWPDTGGATEFMNFLEEKVMPAIQERVPINTDKQMLIGHELGGLFVLNTLFNRPHLFQTYIVGSPLIWWNDHHIVDLEDTLYHILSKWEESGNLQYKRLLLGVGAKEEFMIIDEVRTMYSRLMDWQLSNFEVDLQIFLGEGHVTMMPPLISRGLAHFFEY